jgi:rhodanese-related sulfurtransferase
MNFAPRVASGLMIAFLRGMKILLTLLVTAVVACNVSAEPQKPAKTPATEPAASPKNVSPDEAEALIKGKPGVLILDIRTPDEFAKGHIPGAKNVDFFADDFAKQVAALDASKPVLVHCASGGRSGQAMEPLTALKKFTVIYHLKAGFSGWAAAKKPVEK